MLLRDIAKLGPRSESIWQATWQGVISVSTIIHATDMQRFSNALKLIRFPRSFLMNPTAYFALLLSPQTRNWNLIRSPSAEDPSEKSPLPWSVPTPLSAPLHISKLNSYIFIKPLHKQLPRPRSINRKQAFPYLTCTPWARTLHYFQR